MIVPIENTQMKLNTKKLAVDTNVLLWTFYENTTYIQAYQKEYYPVFLANAIENGRCKIYTTIYNICELFNVIEKNEYELYKENNSDTLPKDFNKKQYRAIKEEREKLKGMFDLLYKQISKCIEIEEYNIDRDVLNEYKEDYDKHKYDVFDFALLKFCKENDINYILTDDSDFASYEDYIRNMKIITANRKMK